MKRLSNTGAHEKSFNVLEKSKERFTSQILEERSIFLILIVSAGGIKQIHVNILEHVAQEPGENQKICRLIALLTNKKGVVGEKIARYIGVIANGFRFGHCESLKKTSIGRYFQCLSREVSRYVQKQFKSSRKTFP